MPAGIWAAAWPHGDLYGTALDLLLSTTFFFLSVPPRLPAWGHPFFGTVIPRMRGECRSGQPDCGHGQEREGPLFSFPEKFLKKNRLSDIVF